MNKELKIVFVQWQTRKKTFFNREEQEINCFNYEKQKTRNCVLLMENKKEEMFPRLWRKGKKIWFFKKEEIVSNYEEQERNVSTVKKKKKWFSNTKNKK